MIFPLCKWYFDIKWHTFEKRWADVFQIYPNAIHLNPLQFCPSMPLLGFPVFCLSSSIVLNRYFHILVNSMTIWSVLKLLKIAWPRAWLRIAWPSPFKYPGIVISDTNPYWKIHIEYIALKISKTEGLIAKLRHFVPLWILLNIFQSANLLLTSLTDYQSGVGDLW